MRRLVKALGTRYFWVSGEILEPTGWSLKGSCPGKIACLERELKLIERLRRPSHRVDRMRPREEPVRMEKGWL